MYGSKAMDLRCPDTLEENRRKRVGSVYKVEGVHQLETRSRLPLPQQPRQTQTLCTKLVGIATIGLRWCASVANTNQIQHQSPKVGLRSVVCCENASVSLAETTEDDEKNVSCVQQRKG